MMNNQENSSAHARTGVDIARILQNLHIPQDIQPQRAVDAD
jgi:hypothetical protein